MLRHVSGRGWVVASREGRATCLRPAAVEAPAPGCLARSILVVVAVLRRAANLPRQLRSRYLPARLDQVLGRHRR